MRTSALSTILSVAAPTPIVAQSPNKPDLNGIWGGGIANQLAVNVPGLNAAVAFYGRQPDAVDVPKIEAAVQLHYAGLDERINAGIPAYEDALKKAGIKPQPLECKEP